MNISLAPSTSAHASANERKIVFRAGTYVTGIPCSISALSRPFGTSMSSVSADPPNTRKSIFAIRCCATLKRLAPPAAPLPVQSCAAARRKTKAHSPRTLRPPQSPPLSPSPSRRSKAQPLVFLVQKKIFPLMVKPPLFRITNRGLSESRSSPLTLISAHGRLRIAHHFLASKKPGLLSGGLPMRQQSLPALLYVFASLSLSSHPAAPCTTIAGGALDEPTDPAFGSSCSSSSASTTQSRYRAGHPSVGKSTTCHYSSNFSLEALNRVLAEVSASRAIVKPKRILSAPSPAPTMRFASSRRAIELYQGSSSIWRAARRQRDEATTARAHRRCLP